MRGGLIPRGYHKWGSKRKREMNGGPYLGVQSVAYDGQPWSTGGPGQAISSGSGMEAWVGTTPAFPAPH